MQRREFITGVAVVGVWPGRSSARADPLEGASAEGRLPRVAVAHTSFALTNLSESSPVILWREFFVHLRELGFVEGRNVIVDRYSALGDPARYSEIARQVGSQRPVVVFCNGQFVDPIRSHAADVPIVVITNDPVVFNVTDTLARGRRKITGISVDAGLELWGKRLEVLKQLVPSARRVGFLVPEAIQETKYRAELDRAGSALGMQIVSVHLTPPFEKAAYETAFVSLKAGRVDGLLIQDGSLNNANRETIIALARDAKLPTIYPFREYATDGGLVAYSVDLAEQGRRAASQVAEILKGRDPDEIPFSLVSRFDLLINLRTAKKLGLRIPPTLLARADEVIE
jgi:putative tryptophan/tyrosine transport system substrate-binding protein